MRTTAGDVAEVHAGMIPIQALLNKIGHRAIVRIATLSEKHPLYIPFKKTSSRMVKRYPTQLHYLANYFGIKIGTIETIETNRKPRIENHKPRITILGDRDKAIDFHKSLTADTLIYCDGSALEGEVGASATIHRRGYKKTLKYRLGSEREHTVYEAELIGIYLGVHLLRGQKNIGNVIIAADNQAALVSTKDRKTRPGNNIVEKTLDEIGRAMRRNKRMTITYSWCP